MSVIKFDGFGKTVSEEHIEAQYTALMSMITATFPEHRAKKLIRLYSDLEGRLLFAPASSKVYYHNAYPGGYLDHIHNVISCSDLVERLYRHKGGKIDYTPEERIFAAMHHDLYKLGDDTGPYYVAETEDFWIRKGAMYIVNEDLDVMTSTDRTFYMLQRYGIEMTYKEMIAIRAADGLYDKANEKYFMASGVFPNRTNLHLIIHWADCMAANIERDEIQARFLD